MHVDPVPAGATDHAPSLEDPGLSGTAEPAGSGDSFEDSDAVAQAVAEDTTVTGLEGGGPPDDGLSPDFSDPGPG